MKLNSHWFLPHLLPMGLLLVTLSSCDSGGKRAARIKDQRQASTPRSVQTVRVRERPIERSIFALGSLVAYEHSTLSTKVAGRVKEIHVDLGSTVKAGDLLLQIEPREYELRVRLAAAALAQARALLGLPLEGGNDQVTLEELSSVKQTRAVLDETKANLERMTQLSQEKIVPISEVDSAKSAYLVASNRYQDALEKARQQQAVVTQRRVECEIAQQQLTDTSILAPFDGGIQERLAHVGEYLTVGDPVLTLVRLDPLKLRVEVSERDAPRVRLGAEVRFAFEGDTKSYASKLERISPALDETNRMLIVEADVQNDVNLHPGSFVRAEIITAAEAQAITIPANAIIAFAGIEKVFAVQSGKAVEKRVVSGVQGPGWVEITSGLARGDEVVIDPGSLQNGASVIPGNGKD